MGRQVFLFFLSCFRSELDVREKENLDKKKKKRSGLVWSREELTIAQHKTDLSVSGAVVQNNFATQKRSLLSSTARAHTQRTGKSTTNKITKGKKKKYERRRVINNAQKKQSGQRARTLGNDLLTGVLIDSCLCNCGGSLKLYFASWGKGRDLQL